MAIIAQAHDMTRDELLFMLVKGDRSLHLGLAIVYGACALATIAFAVGIVMLHKGLMALVFDVGMGVSFGIAALAWWSRYKDDVYALAEIGDDPTGLDTCRTYSARTASVISGSRKTVKELRQQWIAYGILAIVMLAFGAFFAVLLMEDFQGEGVIMLTGAVMLIGGILLSSLAIKAFREWLVARRLERLGSG